MGYYSDECLQITDSFEFDYKNDTNLRHLYTGSDQTPTDIWILNKKKECLLRMKGVYMGMAKEVQELENKLKEANLIDWGDFVEGVRKREDRESKLREANLIKKKRNSR